MDFNLLLFAEICTKTRISARAYYVLSQLCTVISKFAAPMLRKIRNSGLKLMPQICAQLPIHIIKHPINYDRDHTFARYNVNMFWTDGLNLMCDFPFIPNRQMAFANCTLITKFPEPVHAQLFIDGVNIYERQINMLDYLQIRSPINALDEGLYMLNLLLPTRFNPIIVTNRGNTVITLRLKKYELIGNLLHFDDLTFHHLLVVACITRAYSCDIGAYNWDNYGVFVSNDQGQLFARSLVMETQPIEF